MKLSSQAIQLLEELKDRSPRTVEELENEGYDQAMVHRAAMELEENGLVEYREEEEVREVLTEEGEEVAEEGSPEHRLIQGLEDGPREMSEIDLDLDVALGKARQRNWVRIEDDQVGLTQEGRENLDNDDLSERLQEQEFLQQDVARGLVKQETETRRTVELTPEGESVEIRELEQDFNVEARVKTPRVGKKHFYKEVIDYANEVWKEMGFREMEGEFIIPSFWCFDALNIPQDHPAREMQDTFMMELPSESDLSPVQEFVDRVRETHENGWETGSTGWEYSWSEPEARKNVLRTHTTGSSAMKLSELDEKDLPAKYYTTSRVFRNETIDRFHLAEFYQSDGIVVGEDLDFSNLKGYLSKFFEKMGYEEFRLIPAYYPYTEMSVEVQVWDEEEHEWIGMGGAGMFRPEVVKPMLGFEAKVLAWGLGIPRIAMKAAGIDDVRELYRNDIELLEKTPVWRPDRR